MLLSSLSVGGHPSLPRADIVRLDDPAIRDAKVIRPAQQCGYMRAALALIESPGM